MIHLETQYFSINKILLLTVGLWPYRQSKLTRLQFIFLFIILISATIFQFTTFVTLKFYSPILIAQILSTAIFFIAITIIYSSFCVNIDNVKNLLMQIEHIYNELKDKNEIAIIEKYGYNGKRYTTVLTTLAVCSMFLIIIGQFWPEIVNVASPTNKSRLHRMPIMMEYFVNQERYYILILLHIYVAFSIGAMATLATGTMFITFFQHICGMFTISCYRIECAVKFNVLKNNLNKESLISKGIICAIDIHRQAMKLTNNLMSGLDPWIFFLIIFGVASLSLNLLRITYIISFENDIMAIALPVIFILVCILYMFFANSIGQDVIDHNRYIFFAAYNVPWYSAPLRVQKMILFLLGQAAKDFYLTIGGLFSASLECFATLVQASVSYFTVIYSMR